MFKHIFQIIVITVKIIQNTRCRKLIKPIKIAQNTEPFASEAQNGMVYFGTVVCETDDAEKELHTIYSSLHFEPVTDDVEWCVIFHLKQFEEESFLLI